MRRIRLLLPEGDMRRWHELLARRLAAEGADVSIALRAGAAADPGLKLVDQIESLLFSRDNFGLCAPAVPGAWLKQADGSADLVFDLSGAATPAADAIFPLFDGAPGDIARDAALLDGRMPRLQLACMRGGACLVLAEATPAHEQPWLLQAGRAAIAARLTTLARSCARQGGGAGEACALRVATPHSAPRFVAGALAGRVRSRLNRLLVHEGHWRVGVRACAAGEGVMERLAWPENGSWTWVADDRRRYFADPFLFEGDGTVHLFCEEYPYATRKGVISACTLDPSGRPGPMRVVLERPYHLSYPLVFRHEGRIWMMPESSTNGTLELYRADPFPDRWVLDRVLIEGMAISDATFFEADGRFWLTATTSEDGGSSWDCLSLFSGPGPLGHWTRCGAGPVLIDASAARPAGRVERRDGELFRPAQDCTRGYGSGLSLCRIDRVDEGGFAQSVLARLAPPAGAPANGVHTLNRGGGFETIDAVGLRARYAPLSGEGA